MSSPLPKSRFCAVSPVLLNRRFVFTLRYRQEDTSGWLLTDNAASWQGTPSDRGWRYLQQSLKRYDSAENDYRYAKASLETILSVGRSLSSPPWLIDILEVRHCTAMQTITDLIQYTRNTSLNILFVSVCDTKISQML